MYRVLISIAALGLMAAPMAAGAQSLTDSIAPTTRTVFPPVANPHAFTPAPVSSLSGSGLPPSLRAGGAGDAGPMNATPFSGVLSRVLTGSQEAQALDYSRARQDPLAATESGE